MSRPRVTLKALQYRSAVSTGAGPSMDRWDMDLAARMCAACAPATCQRVADKTGFHHETVRRLLGGVNRPTARFVARLCREFHVSADMVLGLRSHAAPARELNRLSKIQSFSDAEMLRELSRRFRSRRATPKRGRTAAPKPRRGRAALAPAKRR